MIPRIVVRDSHDAEFLVLAIRAYSNAVISAMATDEETDLGNMVDFTQYSCTLIIEIANSCTVSAEEGNDDAESSQEVRNGAVRTGIYTTGE